VNNPNQNEQNDAFLLQLRGTEVARRGSRGRTNPCSTAATMVAKLSSARIISEASFAASVPLRPIATPTSACARAGLSLTPSPVIAARVPEHINHETKISGEMQDLLLQEREIWPLHVFRAYDTRTGWKSSNAGFVAGERERERERERRADP